MKIYIYILVIIIFLIPILANDELNKIITPEDIIPKDKDIPSNLCNYQIDNIKYEYQIIINNYTETYCEPICNYSLKLNETNELFNYSTCFGENCINVTKQKEEKKLISEKPFYSCNIINYQSKAQILPKYKEKSGCYICPSNENIYICYSYNDGFAENIDNEWKCKCKSGTTCEVKSI